MSGPELITLGCRLNIAESEAMRALAADADDLVIVNSCAVTEEAMRQARKAIRRARRARPEARILVTGCGAQIDPQAFAAMPEVDRVVGNAEKLDRAAFDFVRNGEDRVQVSDIFAVRTTAPHLAPAFAEHARAFVEVQTGCDHRCTFCVIPQGRGNSRSVPAGAAVERIAALVQAGHAEVVLTGVDLTSYGPDLPGAPSLGLLVERILKHVPGLRRLRLSSLDSVEIDDRLFDLIAHEPRVMPHLHLSLQAGDDMILKRMKRRHDRAQAIALVERLKAARPEIAIGADLIAGFPTEDEAMFDNSLRLIDECDIVFGHIFPYSPRPGTPAARMPQVAHNAIRARAARLRAAAAARRSGWLAGLVGSTQSILVELDGRTGHAANFARIRLTAPAEAGSVQPVRILRVEDDVLIAERAA
ncbi:threonylcarbamoyladenosine tRNA methylthiotransferase MtaB [Sphingomonas zeicaulis]|uniref:tRNA (N(6)-L-threonylcarbamoyladenosine(37)-C(2))- methylthiotransferase MtaB n=1 Tax=Sphingomonas zeicaulis TaxID=1632740 RepID=UPI003D1E51DE